MSFIVISFTHRFLKWSSLANGPCSSSIEVRYLLLTFPYSLKQVLMPICCSLFWPHWEVLLLDLSWKKSISFNYSWSLRLKTVCQKTISASGSSTQSDPPRAPNQQLTQSWDTQDQPQLYLYPYQLWHNIAGSIFQSNSHLFIALSASKEHFGAHTYEFPHDPNLFHTKQSESRVLTQK